MLRMRMFKPSLSLPALLFWGIATFRILQAAPPNPKSPPALPFEGAVNGSVTLAVDALGNGVLDSDIDVIASHIGRGRQFITALDLSDFPFSLSGVLTTVAASGDTLELAFELKTTSFQPTFLEYLGSYQVLGGTGRLSPPTALAEGEGGRGVIEGRAAFEVDMATGFERLHFNHEFRGTLFNSAPGLAARETLGIPPVPNASASPF